MNTQNPLSRRASLDIEKDRQLHARRRTLTQTRPTVAGRPSFSRERVEQNRRRDGATLWGKRSVSALVFASALVVVQGMPANASDPVSSPPHFSVAPSEELQGVVVAAGATPVLTRDGFTVTAPPPPPPIITFAFPASLASRSYTNVASSQVQWPFSVSPISSDFGPRVSPCRGCSSNHKGLDFDPGAGTPIGAMASGIVQEVNSSSGGLGTNVVIDHLVGGERITTVYAHMQAGSVPLQEGDSIDVGATVGKVGNTGASSGAHLHFEVHLKGTPIDPFAFLQANVR